MIGARQAVKMKVLGLHGIPLNAVMATQYLVRHPGEVGQAVRTFEPEAKGVPDKARIHLDIIRDIYRHLITPDEYYLYGFDKLNDEEKHQFVGDIERTVHCARLYNSTSSGLLFMDKLATYDAFKKYYGRKVIGIRGEGCYEEFVCFTSCCSEYLVKPMASSRGEGIHKDCCNRGFEREAFQRVLRSAPCVLEEIIQQGNGMAVFHPQSVNTIRYATYRRDEGFETIACFVKIGRSGNIVDNGGAGGLLAAVDKDSGLIITPGRTEYGEVFETHPDTGVRIKGALIPNWNEAKALISELVDVLPDQRYVGWDLAYSQNGWIMVEGNSGGQFVGPQISLHKGIRPIIDKSFGKL